MTSHAQDALQTEWLDRFGPDVRDPLSRGCLGRSEMIVCGRILMAAAFLNTAEQKQAAKK